MDNNQLDNTHDSFINGPDIDEKGNETLHYDISGFKLFTRRNHNLAYETFPNMRIHWHEEIEIICIRSGHCKYRVNDQIIDLKKGDGIIINSQQLHLILSEEVDYDLDCVLFHPEILCSSEYIKNTFVDPVISQNMPEYLLLHSDNLRDKKIFDDISRLVDLFIMENREMEMLGLLINIWSNIFKKCSQTPKTNSKQNFEIESIKKMLIYIYEHYDEKITISDICKAGNIGKSLCTNLFNLYSNLSPNEFVRQFRINRSIDLLTNTNMSISEIAFAVGFSNSSYFSETFKQFQGISPSDFRNSNF